MDHSEEQPKFEIQPVIEQRPFKNKAVQLFFSKWCEINDSIQPQMVNRDEWEKRGIEGVLKKRPDGKQTLFIAEDLQLWEMVGVMEGVDHDTFVAKPQRQTEAKEKLLALAKTFQNSGVYIAQRLPEIPRGREIAKALAQEFYEYGRSLALGKRPETPLDIDAIASENLTPEETETVDRFLAGDTLYGSRQRRVENELYERERQKTLAQFFRVAEEAFALKSRSRDGKLQQRATQLKPWQSNTPIHNAFLAKIEKAMAQKIETPKREFEASIFRRGIELLQKNMPFDKLPDQIKYPYLHWENGEKTLREALQIDKLKTELEKVRQSEDTALVSEKEREIANRIQFAVSHFPYQEDANNPSEMVANQNINCVGASTLGGALMTEAGLNYLVSDVPRHSILFLITSDGHVEWRDMLNTSFNFNEELTDEMIEGQKKDGTPLTIKDIVAFSRNSAPARLTFDINGPEYKERLHWVMKGQRQYVTVFKPECGHQMQLLNNTGNTLSNLGIQEPDPQKSREYFEQAVEAHRQAIALDPRYPNPYKGLGNALHSLYRNKEAVEAYQEFIDLSDKTKDAIQIRITKEIIAAWTWRR